MKKNLDKEVDDIFAATRDELPDSLDLDDPKVVHAVKEAIRHDLREWLRMTPMREAVAVGRALQGKRRH